MSDLYYPLGSCVLLDLLLYTAMDTRVGRSLNDYRLKKDCRILVHMLEIVTLSGTERSSPCIIIFLLYCHYYCCFMVLEYLSQENPNYSFLLPFAQYNLQCPGYCLPVLQGKWVYPHSSSTCRIWNKIISYSAIRRDPHRGGWVVGRAGGRQVAFFRRSGKRRCIFFHRSCW